jgi:hypothetical protein
VSVNKPNSVLDCQYTVNQQVLLRIQTQILREQDQEIIASNVAPELHGIVLGPTTGSALIRQQPLLTRQIARKTRRSLGLITRMDPLWW